MKTKRSQSWSYVMKKESFKVGAMLVKTKGSGAEAIFMKGKISRARAVSFLCQLHSPVCKH